MTVIAHFSKKQRHVKLLEYLEENPFTTDEDLAKKFEVSIQTIRLDRLELGIPELRERIKSMASRTFDDVKSLQENEVIGDIIDLQLNKHGISMFDITEDNIFKKTEIARGHYIFAQANSLAIALIDQEIALTSKADIRFVSPVRLNDRLIAKANVINSTTDRSEVEVNTYVGEK